MDLKSWKVYKRSGTYRRAVQKQYKQVVSRSKSVINNESEVRAISLQCGSVQNVVCSNEATNRDSSDPDISDCSSQSSCCDIAEEKNAQLRHEIKKWAIDYNISQQATKSLIQIINNRLPNILPTDPRTLLNTQSSITTYPVVTGQYWHNGLIDSLKGCLQKVDCDLSLISINVNIDGLPAFKSSKLQLWPILCNIYEIPKLQPIVVGIYAGLDKPSADLDGFLNMFIHEMKILLTDGLSVTSGENEKKIGVKLRAFICDSPARAMIKGVCNYNGKDGCLKCTVEGEYSYISHTVVFPRIGCPKRNDADFRAKKYEQHHKTDSPLLELPIDMIEDFVVGDALHLIDLGIMKRLLNGWKDGKFNKYTKWSGQDITTVTSFLVSCKMPREIHRSVRGLDHIHFWKGSEYRTFLYYLSFIILKHTLTSEAYQHFLYLFCAITICSNEKYFTFLSVAESLLNDYLEYFRDIYGECYMTSNVHNLSHIIDEVKKLGILQSFSTYPFENRLYYLKRMIRHGNRPLEQVAKRISEKIDTELDNYTTDTFEKPFVTCNGNVNKSILHLEDFILSLRKEDRWFLDRQNNIVEVQSLLNDANGIIIHGNRYDPVEDVFIYPVKSSCLNIYKCKVSTIKKTTGLYKVDDIKCKLVSISYRSELFFVPLLHTFSSATSR